MTRFTNGLLGVVVTAGSCLVLACGSDDATGSGSTNKLAVLPIADQSARTNFAAPVLVEIQRPDGSLITTATNSVTLALGTNAGNILWHASGRLGGEILEAIDPGTPEVLSGPAVTFGDEISGMTYNASTNRLIGGDIDGNLVSINPADGTETIVGPADTASYLTGLAFETGASPRLLGVMQGTSDLYTLNLTTGAATSLGMITVAGDSVLGATGLATNPLTGTVYAVLKLETSVGRNRTLVTINPATRVATVIGELGEDGMADIAFLSDGTLVGVTGDGATTASTLFTINITTAGTTFLLTLGNGDDGEAIAAVPATLSGTLTVPAVDGVATFPGLQINAAADGYTISASASGLTAGTSAAFDVTP